MEKLFKRKARDVEEMALMHRIPGVHALPASGPWYSTEGSKEALYSPRWKHFTLLPQEIQGWYCFGPVPRYPNSCDKPRQIW